MKKVSLLIALFLSVFIGLATLQSGEFSLENVIIFCVFEFIMIYLLTNGVFSFFHKIGKNAADITRKEGSKYEKTLGSDYIRELPSYYTPALVSFVQDSAIEYNKDVLGTILHLINDDYLK